VVSWYPTVSDVLLMDERPRRPHRQEDAMSVPVVRLDRIPLRRPAVLFRLETEMVVETSQRVLVRTRAVALPFDDLDFSVRGGKGLAAVCRDEISDSVRPSVLLLAGSAPGDYWLVATQRCTGTVVGQARFTVNQPSGCIGWNGLGPQVRWIPPDPRPAVVAQ
jgi:hypothetical protein